MKQNDIRMTEEEFKKVITSTVKETLTNLGCQTDDPIEMQKDFAHLRDGRLSTEAIRKKGTLAAIGFFVVAALGYLLKVITGDG